MKPRHFLTLLIVAAAAGLASYRVALGWQAQSTSKPHIAISWTETEFRADAATLAAPVRTLLYAVRPDGARVTAVVGPKGQILSRLLILPDQRKRVTILEDLQTLTSVYFNDQKADEYRRYSGNDTCSNISVMKLVGEEDVQGHRTYKYTHTSSVNGETATFTSWFAPDLECISLKSSADVSKNGKTSSGVKEVSNLRLGEPDPALFLIPPDYKEMGPLAVEIFRGEKLGRPVPPPVLESAARSDEKYQASQKDKP